MTNERNFNDQIPKKIQFCQLKKFEKFLEPFQNLYHGYKFKICNGNIKIGLLTIIALFIATLNANCQYGGSISFSSSNAYGINVFFDVGNDIYYFGYSEQLAGQKNTAVGERKKTYGTTQTGTGSFFWLMDFGFCRQFDETYSPRLIPVKIQSEISIGSRNSFTNYSDKRFTDSGYSLINESKTIIGAGINVGYKLEDNIIEPYLGFHTIKKLTFGIRLHFN